MCGLNQDSGLGKVIDKSTGFIHKYSLGGMAAQEIKKAVHGKEFVENGGYGASMYNNYQSEDKAKKSKVLDSAPAFGTPEYAKWYDANKQTLLG